MKKYSVRKLMLILGAIVLITALLGTFAGCGLLGSVIGEEKKDDTDGEKTEEKNEANKVLKEKLDRQIDEVIANNNNGTQAYGNFKDINLEGSYLGYGYNVVNSPYMDKNSINMAYPIVDPMELKDVTLKMVKENRSYTYEIESSSITEFASNYSNKLSVSAGAGQFFSLGLQAMFGGSSEEKAFYKFFNSTSSVHTFNLYMVAYQDKLRDILSSAFKSALLNMDAVKLFETYGTHMINSVAMGGRIEANNVYSSTSKKCTADIETAINAHAKAGLVASADTETSAKYSEMLNQNNVQTQTEIRQLGGKLVNTGNLKALADNYQAWFESFYEDLSVSAVCGVVNGTSLTPIWELLPDGYEERAKELEDTFNRYAEDNYNALIAQYKLKPSVPAKTYSLNIKPKNCDNDKGYDVERPTSLDLAINEIDPNLCDLIINGCIQEGVGYTIAGSGENSEISLGIKLIQDPNSIRLLHPPGSGVYKAFVGTDTATAAQNTNINKQIGKGAVYINVEYTDRTTTQGFATNIFDGKTKDSFIDILSATGVKIKDNKTVREITIDILFEVHAPWSRGVGKTVTNWRMHTTLIFN